MFHVHQCFKTDGDRQRTDVESEFGTEGEFVTQHLHDALIEIDKKLFEARKQLYYVDRCVCCYLICAQKSRWLLPGPSRPCFRRQCIHAWLYKPTYILVSALILCMHMNMICTVTPNILFADLTICASQRR
jgi:hypothetical protein